ncbi:MAG: aldose 1-epimerase, partial [Alphaproteobacteria bacterium]|nr:aldose 1-epimerase [Alphaproteobacteria bacterium]
DDPFPDIVTLKSGQARIAVSPTLGGVIAGYWSEGATRLNWLSPSANSAVPGAQDFRLASFPLVPYSNRIRDGRFPFEGRTVSEPMPAGAGASIHGHGRKSPWRVAEAQDDRLAIDYEHAPGSWPWRYRARQEFALTPDSLEVRLGVENLSAEDMPAGLGHHPYFPRTPETRVTADIAAIWLPEAGGFPTERFPPPPGMDPRQGVMPEQTSLDHAFAGWTHRAVIEWPERKARLVMTADPALSTLIIYSPPGKEFVCVEPTSHCVDAFNLAAAGVADTGLRVLKPGERWETWVRLEPQAMG